MDEALKYLFFLITAMAGVNTFFALKGKVRILKYSGLVTAAFALAGYVGVIVVSGHAPASGDFEKSINVVFVLSLLGTLNLFRHGTVPQSLLFWPLALFFMGYALFFPLETGKDFFMYHNPWVVAFFQLRIASIALIAYAFSVSISGLMAHSGSRTGFISRTRNYTLLGAALFLAGEFSGSVWAWLGWGDPWRWSRGFFMASVMFLLAIAAGHLPASVMASDRRRLWYSTVLLFLILIAYYI